MNQLRRMFASPQRLLLLAIGLLLLPALLTHLGLLAFSGDEAIRALVALEMRITGNYITPTMFGEFYYNKPPLYNWILLAVFNLTGRSDEFVARLPTVFFLLAYATTVWFFVKKHTSSLGTPIFNFQFSILNSLALITCGRILFWDSMLGLIDMSFSWVMYSMFMVIFTQGERGRYVQQFAIAYLLAAVGFLLKGLPAVVFLGVALLTYFFWVKKWRKLFSLAHIGGMAVFGVVVGSYYALYAQQNGLSTVFSTLFHESAKRTFVEYGLGKTLLHLVTFPFEMWYHFLPWTILVVYLLRKNALQLLLQHRFIAWNGLVFITTILPYWASVEVYPRYLLMLVPMAYTVFFYLHFKNKEIGSPVVQWVEGVFQVLIWGMLAASFAPLLWPAVQQVPFLYLKVGFLAAATGLLLWVYRRWEVHRLLAFVAVMLVGRMAFNWFVMPTRLEIDCQNLVRQTTLDAAQKLEGRPLFIYEESIGLEPTTGYYFTRETHQILRREKAGFDKEARYILDVYRYPVKYSQIAKIKTLWQCEDKSVVKLK
ncbi:MAG: glycosyl transferase [Bacteroidetes bacterium]|nr:glycosyl transferase [Bacteroidota bacterium]